MFAVKTRSSLGPRERVKDRTRGMSRDWGEREKKERVERERKSEKEDIILAARSDMPHSAYRFTCFAENFPRVPSDSLPRVVLSRATRTQSSDSHLSVPSAMEFFRKTLSR